jgi:hypothetical protein
LVFDGEGTGYNADNCLITLDMYFSMQDFDSNVKERHAIIHLKVFVATWWKIEENKLGVDMHTIMWELFLEHICE